MSVVAPKVYQSTDTGAPTLSGTAGDLVEVLSSCLVVRKAFAAVSGASFLDRTAEARLVGGTPFTMMQTPGTSDEFYVGMCQPFERIAFTLSTLGVGGTYVWEYWNGSAWTAFAPADGTSGFTASGAVTWAIASLTGWATHAVNSATLYWVRVRLTVANSTNPTVGNLTCTGWTEAFTGTNGRSYQQGGGNQFYLDVNDNGPGAGGAKEARTFGYEAMSAYGTGTNAFPTAAQVSTGITIRKSAAASATTRLWLVWADDRTAYVLIIPGDASSYYTTFGFGDFYSFVLNDPYRTMIMGRQVENTAVSVATDPASVDDFTPFASNNVGFTTFFSPAGRYIARAYTASVGSVVMNAFGDPSVGISPQQGSNTPRPLAGGMSYPNLADGGAYASPMKVYENSTGAYRGLLRGLWHWSHAYNAVADRTTLSGSGAMAGRSFIVAQPLCQSSTGTGSTPGAALLETSDTLNVN